MHEVARSNRRGSVVCILNLFSLTNLSSVGFTSHGSGDSVVVLEDQVTDRVTHLLHLRCAVRRLRHRNIITPSQRLPRPLLHLTQPRRRRVRLLALRLHGFKLLDQLVLDLLPSNLLIDLLQFLFPILLYRFLTELGFPLLCTPHERVGFPLLAALFVRYIIIGLTLELLQPQPLVLRHILLVENELTRHR